VPPFPKEFPGKKNGGDLCRRLRALTRKSGTQSAAADTVDRRELARSLEELAVPYFNILLEALEVPTGVVPQMPALQDERVRALLDWSEGDGAAPSVLRALVAEVRDTVAAATPLDQRTPDPLARNAVDSCDAELADLEELGRAYVAVKQWPKAFFTFRTLVDLAAERDIRAYARGLRYLGKVHLEYREYANAERSLKQSLAVWDRYLERDPRAPEEAEITRGLLEELERRSAAAAARQEGDGPAAATQ
jgi:tetratricopeptide (TPR) repeat protein